MRILRIRVDNTPIFCMHQGEMWCTKCESNIPEIWASMH